MDNVLKTKFNVWSFVWNLGPGQMRKEAEQIGLDLGIIYKDEIDAFRHAYVAAKMQETFGPDFSRAMGELNEEARDVFNQALSLGEKNNPQGQWDQDLFNNTVGQNIEKEIARDGSHGDEKERRLRLRILKAVRTKELQLEHVNTPRRPKRESPTFDSLFPGTPTYGEVAVTGYRRATGEVQSHSRSRPDGDEPNNWSYKVRPKAATK